MKFFIQNKFPKLEYHKHRLNNKKSAKFLTKDYGNHLFNLTIPRWQAILWVNKQGTMNRGSQEFNMCMIEKCPSLVFHCKLVYLGPSTLNRALCYVNWPICIVGTILPYSMPAETIATQPLGQFPKSALPVL